MSTAQLLAEISARGLSISAAGADLRLQGPRDRMDPELIGRVRAAKADLIAVLSGPIGPAPVEPDPVGLPLTPLQRSYLFGRGDLFEMGNVANHVYREMEGTWDLDRLEAALRSVVRRHPVLRHTFTADGRQVERPAVEVSIGRLDLRGRTADEQATLRAELRAARSHRVLPADAAPLLAVDVTILADDHMVLHVSQDGLVMDGVSSFLFLREWWEAYQGSSTEAAGVPFADYLAALDRIAASPAAQRSRGYWLDRLDDLPPAPDLPLAASPSAIACPRFSPRSIRLDPAAWTAFKKYAAGFGLTPSSVLLAAYAETLAAWGAGARFTLTTTVANRPPVHPRMPYAIGAFSDPMLVAVDVDRRRPFVDRARELQARLRSDLDNRHFSGVEVLRELGRRAGDAGGVRMPYTFNSAIGYLLPNVDGSTLDLFGTEAYSVSQTPQVWLNAFAMERHGGLFVQIDGVDELFPAGFLDALVAGYGRLVTALAEPDAWAGGPVDLLPADQRERRRIANDTAVDVPAAMLQDAFIARAEGNPGAAAILTTGSAMSYGELYRRARMVAAWLRAREAGRDELVGLVMRRGPEQIVGILGTLMAGAAYLPVDADLPAERRAYLLHDGRVRYVLTNMDDAGTGREALRLDAGVPVPDAVPALAPVPAADPDDLAYVLYTSGTTGEPKGVMVSHRSVANVVADCAGRFGIGERDRFFGISAFSFDLSVYDVFGALSAGAAIVLPDHDRSADAAHWLALCGTAGVTVWNSVPALVSLLRDQAEADGVGPLGLLRLIMMSGDRIPAGLPVALRALRPELRLVSLGGPTETTIWNITHPIGPADDGSRPIPYGRPTANNRAYVIDADGMDAPDWVAGEICAAGTGLARGYWDDEERTATRFSHDERRGVRVYRTGDIGRYLPDGGIEILGRTDHQIKVNGYRVEAGEIESRLLALGPVAAAAVVRQAGTHGARLVAHLVLVPGGDRPSDEDIRGHLRVHLPEYMVPMTYVWRDSLPLTRNGKVDRTRLATESAPGPALSGLTSAASEASGARREDDAERAPGPARAERAQLDTVAALWAAVLGRPDVAADARFADLGGDSIAAARIVTSVRREFGVVIPLHKLPQVDTVRRMVAYLSSVTGGQP